MVPAVVWLTGYSGAGKTTIGTALVARLDGAGIPAVLLDGDEIRRTTGTVGFSRADRDRHVEAVGQMAARSEQEGRLAVVALISPYRASRAAARKACRRFLEVHVATSLEVCEARDPKGLYARARSGAISQFTGIDDPYEAPLHPDLTIPDGTPVAAAVEAIFQRLLAE